MELKIWHNGYYEIIECKDIKYGGGELKIKEDHNFEISYGINEERFLIPDRFFFDQNFDKMCEKLRNGKVMPCRWIIVFGQETSEVFVFNEPSETTEKHPELNICRCYLMQNGKTVEVLF